MLGFLKSLSIYLSTTILSFLFRFLTIQMKTERCLFMKHLLTSIWRIYFHSAYQLFENFKDEKISDYKTVSVVGNKKLAGLKTWGVFFSFLVFFFIFLFFSKSCIKHRQKKSFKFDYEFSAGIVNIKMVLIQEYSIVIFGIQCESEYRSRKWKIAWKINFFASQGRVPWYVLCSN